MKKQYQYHSAMARYGGVDESSDQEDDRIFRNDKIITFQHDICSPDIPEEFRRADAVFTIMSWRSGYKKYTEHTIAKDTDFNQYCEAIGNAIRELNVPGFIVTNKTFCKRLNADRYAYIHYDQFDSDDVCAVWNYNGTTPASSVELLKWVCDKWETVLDFCCGHGLVADYAKKCILTDVNTGCIDYIRQRYIDG